MAVEVLGGAGLVRLGPDGLLPTIHLLLALLAQGLVTFAAAAPSTSTPMHNPYAAPPGFTLCPAERTGGGAVFVLMVSGSLVSVFRGGGSLQRLAAVL